MNEEQRRRLISQLNGRTQMAAFGAAKLIWNDSDKRLEPLLISTLRSGRRPFNRAAAAYSMGALKKTRAIIAELERTVANQSEHPRVRGEAAEALVLGHRRKSHDVLLQGLSDRSKDVRFWCAYALGEMAEERAVAALEHLVTTDKRLVRGFHSVAQEAADALKNIRTEKPFHRRKHGCVFCVRSSGR